MVSEIIFVLLHWYNVWQNLYRMVLLSHFIFITCISFTIINEITRTETTNRNILGFTSFLLVYFESLVQIVSCSMYTITKPYPEKNSYCRFHSIGNNRYSWKQKLSIANDFCQSIPIDIFFCEFDCYRLQKSIDSNRWLISIESIDFWSRFLSIDCARDVWVESILVPAQIVDTD